MFARRGRRRVARVPRRWLRSRNGDRQDYCRRAARRRRCRARAADRRSRASDRRLNDRLPLQQAHRVRAPTQAPKPVLSMASSYRRVRAATEALATPLSAEDCAIQSMPDASPVKWHLAHTSWFFETFVLGPHLPGYRVHDTAFRFLFNSYYNAIGDRHPRPRRGLLSRPSLDAVRAYRAHVDEAMSALFTQETPISLS